MAAFDPIPASAAIVLMEQAGFADPLARLANYARAGLVKGYASWMEKVQPSGVRDSVRSKRIEPEMWRRIIEEGKVAEIASDTITLTGSPEFGGGPKVVLTGFRFGEASVRAVIADHSSSPRKVAAPNSPPSAAPPEAQVSSSDNKPSNGPASKARPDVAPIAPGAKLATTAQAMAALGCGRTTIHEMCIAGRLEKVRGVGGVRITVASIEAVARGER